MNAKLHALESTNTWKIALLPPGKHVVDCKWLFKIKYKPNGELERYKARFVARGYTQQEGLDCFETFALVAKISTIQNILALAAAHNYFLR